MGYMLNVNLNFRMVILVPSLIFKEMLFVG